MVTCMTPTQMEYFLSLVPWKLVDDGIAILAVQGTVVWTFVEDTNLFCLI